MVINNKNKWLPTLNMPFSIWEILLEIISLAGIGAIFMLVETYRDIVPNRVPNHFGINGTAFSWGDRTVLNFLPIASVILYLVISVLSFYPHVFDYPWHITKENTATQYRLARFLMNGLKLECIALALYTQWITIQVSLGQAEGLGFLFYPSFILLILITVIIYIIVAHVKK